ncbi:ABC transporter permease subunit [Georgenia sp. SYP-B2076]|uniref:ABC transporter permease subunit n=1 Tax=Georgenia sp. SYP-B2076 TaxID=2495881 RepID=UPI0013E05AC4|nr:ABC transporter permease subunit [Georgenia sp. SYP-B2076]
MSPVTTSPAVASRRHLRDVHPRLTFGGTLRSEWIKLFSLRSTWWTLGLTVVLMSGFALLQAYGVGLMLDGRIPAGAPGATSEQAASFEIIGAEVVTGGYQVGVLTVAVLGALLLTGEYSTGMIRSTLSAVPRRLSMLAAKALTITVVTVGVSVVGLVVAALVSAPLLSGHDLVPALDDARTWQVVGGMTYFFVVAGLFALGLAAIIRSTAGTITAVVTVLLLLPGVLQFVNLDWVQDAMTYLPLPAATSFLSVSNAFSAASPLAAWEGVGVVGAYAVVALGAGAVVLRRRDA